MQNLFKERHHLLGLIVALYIAPLCVITAWFMQAIEPSQAWSIFSTGLFCCIAGSLAIFFALRHWEWNVQLENRSPNEIETLEAKISELQETNTALTSQLEEKNCNLSEVNPVTEFSENLIASKAEAEKKLEQNELYIHELHQEISQYKMAVQEKENWIAELESQVQDRTYELQTLLKLSEVSQAKKEALVGKEEEAFSFPLLNPLRSNYHSSDEVTDMKVHTSEGATSHLKRCIAVAQKMTGVNHFSSSGSSLFRDLPVNSYALDLRRLCDSLGSENTVAVALYSKKEDKLLFANSEIKNLLGWSSEKFLQDFSEIVLEGYSDWKNKIYSLMEFEEAKIRLLVKTKSGENLLLNCHIGVIPTGIFRNHAIAVFYSA